MTTITTIIASFVAFLCVIFGWLFEAALMLIAFVGLITVGGVLVGFPVAIITKWLGLGQPSDSTTTAGKLTDFACLIGVLLTAILLVTC